MNITKTGMVFKFLSKLWKIVDFVILPRSTRELAKINEKYEEMNKLMEKRNLTELEGAMVRLNKNRSRIVADLTEIYVWTTVCKFKFHREKIDLLTRILEQILSIK